MGDELFTVLGKLRGLEQVIRKDRSCRISAEPEKPRRFFTVI